MALLPLHTLLICVEELHKIFARILKEYKVSFSAGLVIAHALEPLSGLLGLARAAEDRAKKVDGKDAVAFTVCSRSGANIEVVGKWTDLIPLLLEVSDSYRAKATSTKRLSLGLARELSDLNRRTPPQLDSILKELALAAAGKKRENQKAIDLIERYVRDRASLHHLSQVMLTARPIYRAVRESLG
jgi:CRISPR-associated protein Cmr2